MNMEKLFLGMCLKKDDKLVLIGSYGYKTNLNLDDEETDAGYIDYLINNESSKSFERAEITTHRLEDIGFKRNRSNCDYVLDINDRSIIIRFETNGKVDNSLAFKYFNKKEEFVCCNYIDELQSLYKEDFGEVFNLNNLFVNNITT